MFQFVPSLTHQFVRSKNRKKYICIVPQMPSFQKQTLFHIHGHGDRKTISNYLTNNFMLDGIFHQFTERQLLKNQPPLYIVRLNNLQLRQTITTLRLLLSAPNFLVLCSNIISSTLLTFISLETISHLILLGHMFHLTLFLVPNTHYCSLPTSTQVNTRIAINLSSSDDRNRNPAKTPIKPDRHNKQDFSKNIWTNDQLGTCVHAEQHYNRGFLFQSKVATSTSKHILTKYMQVHGV